KYMRADPQIKIQYASKFARIANYWKKWQGETLGLKKSNAVGIKKQQETALISEINKKGKQQEYGQLLPQFETYYTQIEPYALAREYYLETVMRNVELLRTAFQVYQLKQVYENRGAQSFEDRRNNLISSLEGQYKNYNNQVDKEVFEALITLFAKNVPAEFLPTSFKNMNVETVTNNIYKNSAFVDYAFVKNLLEGDADRKSTRLNSSHVK